MLEVQLAGMGRVVMAYIVQSEFTGMRVAGTGGKKYLTWKCPVWKPDTRARVQRYRTHANARYTPTRISPAAPPGRARKLVWEVITWNARGFGAETAANMLSWLHERTSANRRPGVLCLTETWQLPDAEMPDLPGYSTIIAKPRTLHGVRASASGGVAVYVHDALRHIVSDAECVCDGESDNFEAGIVLKIRNAHRHRHEFIAVIYGEIDRPAAGVRVDKRRMLLTIDRWRKQVRGPMWVVGDQNIHAGTAQMDQWTDTLQCERMDTGPVPSYIRLDGHRGTDREYTSIPLITSFVL
jgi:hypothetical protein